MNAILRILALLFASFSSMVLAQNVFTTPGGGDPNSFGHSLIYLGLGQSANVVFDTTCGPEAEVVPPDVCVAVPADGSQVNFAFADLGSMVIPAKSTTSTLWPMMISIINVNFQDFTGNGGRARFWGNVIITVESPVLNDPTIVDPSTGLPANGKIVATFPASHSIDQHINSNDHFHFRERSDASGINAFTSSFLGLTPKQLADLFKNPITLRWGLSGTVRNAAAGFFITSFRIMGDR